MVLVTSLVSVLAFEWRSGFASQPPAARADTETAAEWPDWRGPRRDAISDDVPERLPAEKRLLWSRTLTGPGMSGLAVAAGSIVVADKDQREENDVFRCLDADTGREIWRITYPAAGEMDFTNSPRANPVICDGMVYLHGAFGDLHCVKLKSGEVVWRRNLLKDFGAELPEWGTCSTPLIVDEKLIVNPGAKNASLAALDRLTGRVIWTTPGDPPAYGAGGRSLPANQPHLRSLARNDRPTSRGAM